MMQYFFLHTQYNRQEISDIFVGMFFKFNGPNNANCNEAEKAELLFS